MISTFHGAFCWLVCFTLLFLQDSQTCNYRRHAANINVLNSSSIFQQNENLSLEFIVLSNFHYHPKFNSFLSSTIGWKPHLHKTIHLRPRRIQKKELKCRDFYISREIGVILVVQANYVPKSWFCLFVVKTCKTSQIGGLG